VQVQKLGVEEAIALPKCYSLCDVDMFENYKWGIFFLNPRGSENVSSFQ